MAKLFLPTPYILLYLKRNKWHTQIMEVIIIKNKIMSKQACINVEGEVLESLGNSIFRVKLDNGAIVIAHLSGKIRLNSIQVLPQDRVSCEMSVYDLSKARIVRRLNPR